MKNELFAELSQRVTNVPLCIHPAKAEVIMAAIGERMGFARMKRFADDDGDAWDDAYASVDREGSNPRRGYDLVEGVAVIQVKGTLVQRTHTLRPYSGMTGYDGVRQNFLTALTDRRVRAIVLDIDSPGGEVCGCFDLVDTIHRARGVKPIWSILSENAYSAAYALASAADCITVPRTGGTGSVGVIYMHTSIEGLLQDSGVEVTLVTKGDLKGEGNEFQNLSKETFDRLRADVLKVGDLFDRTVARNRGMAVKDVFDTQAGTFLGKAGVKIGFADAVMAPDEAFRALLDELG
ncbi:MAG: S49 family peptidase [Phenylobacterium sp.]|nr:S49 family peptidase [Phenylobacterium sp.]